MATTQMTGTGASMVNVMRNVCCTTFASESVRVIMEPVPSWSKSYPPSSSDFSYTATRMSLPTRAARRLASQYDTRQPPDPTTAATSIEMPWASMPPASVEDTAVLMRAESSVGM